MEMKQQNLWEKMPQVKKGDLGEKIVRKYLEAKGWVIYEPVGNMAHFTDKFAVKDKKEIILIEVKTKPKLNYYDGTGFDFRSYNQYKILSHKHNMRVFIFFVDEMLGKIYGNFLSELEKPIIYKKKNYPFFLNKIIIFPLCYMKLVKILNENEILEIKKYNTRNYEYLQ